MRTKTFSLAALISAAALFVACGGTTESPVNTAATNTANANQAATANSSGPLAVTTPTPKETTNNAPTLTPVYQAYCTAVEKKDDAALRRVVATETVKYWEEDMRDQGIKSLSAYLAEEQNSSQQCEVRNEQISGDTAVAEIRSKAYPNGLEIVFVKENGQWKLTNRSPAVPPQK